MTPLFTERVRVGWDDWLCNPARMVRIPFPGPTRTWNLLVADASIPAWEAFIRIMYRHQYLFRETAGGTYNCRHTNHNPDLPMSLHSNGVCIDLNPSKNPQGTNTTDMPAAFRADLKALRCRNGRPVFRWGGDWLGAISDPMHWQLACTPADIRTGIHDPNQENPMDHKHTPMPSELPRDWADGTWDEWVARSGTLPQTRGDTFYREDLGWVYSRVIRPLELHVERLEKRLSAIETSGAPVDPHHHDNRYVRKGVDVRIN